MKVAHSNRSHPGRIDGTDSEYATDRLIRLSDVLRIVPLSRSTWWAGIKTGRYPAPVRIGARSVAWRASEIASLLEKGVK